MVLTKISCTYATFVCWFVQFQINNHFIPYEPMIIVRHVSIKKKYFASYRLILLLLLILLNAAKHRVDDIQQIQ